MSILTRFRTAFAQKRGEAYWEKVVDTMRGGVNKSGVNVTDSNAVTFSAVAQSLELIGGTMSTMPLQTFKRTDTGRELYRDHFLYGIFHDQANKITSAQNFRERFVRQMEIHGIAIAEKVFDRSGRLRELHNIDSLELMQVYLDAGGNIRFKLANGLEYGTDKIFYCYGPGQDGFNPLSRIKTASASIGLALAAQQYGELFFGQGTHNGGFIETEKGLSDVAFERLKASVIDAYSGLGRSHKLMFMENGMKFTPAGSTNENAQFLETRKFQIAEVARFFNIKSYMIGDLEKATFSNIEHQGIEAVTYCWQPRANRIEQAINQQLLEPFERGTVYVEHNLNGLKKGDLASQMTVWTQGVNAGIFNADEVRAMMNMNNQPDGQGLIYYRPLNMQDKTEPIATDEPQQIDDTDERSIFRTLEPTLRKNPTIEAFRMASVALIPEFTAKYRRFDSEMYLKTVEKVLSGLEKRSEKGIDVDFEMTRMRNAFTFSALQAANIKKITWISRDNCPICSHLNGKKIDITGSFSAEKTLKHPPFDIGCDCDIIGGNDD